MAEFLNKLYSWSKVKEEDEDKLLTEINKIDTNALLPQEHQNKAAVKNKAPQADQDKGIQAEVAKNMPPTIKDYLGKYKIIQDREYAYIDDEQRVHNATKKPSAYYMQPIIESLKELEEQLDTECNHLDDESIFPVQRAFLNACDACQIYLKKRKNPWTDEGKARYQMISDISEQLHMESMSFYDRVCEAREDASIIMGNAIDEDASITTGNAIYTWADFLGRVRCKTYVEGKDNCKVNIGGAGTSELFILETKAKEENKENPGEKIEKLKTQYFKENDRIPTEGMAEITKLQRKELAEYSKNYLSINKDLTEEEKAKHKTSMDFRDKYLVAVNKLFKKMFSGDDNAMIAYVLDETRSTDEKLWSDIYEELLDYFGKDTDEYTEFNNAVTRVLNEKNILKDNLEKATTDEEKRKIQKQIDDSDYGFMTSSLRKLAKMANAQDVAENCAGIAKGAELAKRNVATARIAEMLGLKDLVVHSEMADVVINGKRMRGVMMDHAEGDLIPNIYNGAIAANKKTKYSVQAVRSLLNLQILDIICGQVDRNNGNFLATSKMENGTCVIDKITGIDNDMAFGCLSYSDICKDTINKKVSGIFENGKLRVPCIDNALAKQILDLNIETVRFKMIDLLSKEERDYLADRIRGLQEAILELQHQERKAKQKLKREKEKAILKLQKEAEKAILKLQSEEDKEKLRNKFEKDKKEIESKKFVSKFIDNNDKQWEEAFDDYKTKMKDRAGLEGGNFIGNYIISTTYFESELILRS